MSESKRHLPIGVFDSGVGGLTVLAALRQAFPHESFLYLGDTARLPYGTKGPDTVVRYAKQASQVLFQQGIKCLVIACNTASAVCLPAVREAHPETPILGVLEPGAMAACAASQNGKIGVIATEATVKTGSYTQAIKNLRQDAMVFSESAPLLVALAEEGWHHAGISEAIIKEYNQRLFSQPSATEIDCVVLGCTHFPVFKNTFKQLLGSHIKIVDSASTTATKLAELLKLENLATSNTTAGNVTYFVTDTPDRFATAANRFLDLELAIHDIEHVDI